MTVDRLIREVRSWGEPRLADEFVRAFDSLILHIEAHERRGGRTIPEGNLLDKLKGYRDQFDEATSERKGMQKLKICPSLWQGRNRRGLFADRETCGWLSGNEWASDADSSLRLRVLLRWNSRPD